MNKKFKKTIINTFVIATLACNSVSIIASAAGLSPNGKQFYIPKKCSSTASETLNEDADIFSFKVTKILNGKKKSSNYKRIRIKAKSDSNETAWLDGTGFSGSNCCSVISGRYTKSLDFKVYKGTYCEIVPATFGKAQYSFYYYGNDPDLDAYATIQSNWA